MSTLILSVFFGGSAIAALLVLLDISPLDALRFLASPFCFSREDRMRKMFVQATELMRSREQEIVETIKAEGVFAADLPCGCRFVATEDKIFFTK